MRTSSVACAMPTGGNRSGSLVDTSAAVALLVGDHDQHDSTFEALAGRRLGLAGHAAFETFSVLTRLPAPARRTAVVVDRLLRANFPHSRFLSPDRAADLLAVLPAHGIAGGSVYDALIAATAVEHRLRLVTLDRRAVDTYRALEAEIELLS